MTVGNKKMKFSEVSPQPELTERVLEDIKLKCCFVTTLERSQRIFSAIEAKQLGSVDFYGHLGEIDFQFAPDCDFPLDSCSILHVPGWLRELACEVLFVNRVDSQLTLPRLILSTLAKAPVDLKRDLASNIVLIGGGFMLPGCKSRLADEIKSILENSNDPDEFDKRLPFKKVAYHRPPALDNYTAWLGAAIFANLEVLDLYSIHNAKFKETQKLPDWFQVTASHKSEMLSI